MEIQQRYFYILNTTKSLSDYDFTSCPAVSVKEREKKMKNQTQTTKHKNIFLHSIVIITTLSVSIGYGRAGFANLTQTLAQFCVPKPGGCTADIKATYNQSLNICECDSNLKHYNSDNRACEECITNSSASSDYKTCEPMKCPSGMVPTLITNGVCPNGYGLQKISNGGCPSGFALKSYSVSSKTWN